MREPAPTTRTVPLGSRSGRGSARLLARRLVPDDRVLVVGVPAGPVHAARDRLQLVLFVAAPLLVLLLALAAGPSSGPRSGRWTR
ncbi:hypothetical protein [Actinomadura madurae]|uniref:hypothetical protein n=1 Tax=Actinomadura madurae TaxID=1993 RepID=UPI0020D20100|nr:hypothetical protein [Actinomadura madurae]MCP9984491.1 hypothetical protein [Actinomadura madurae]MCQ0020685.1 hypothetical protein [Actinomadura madurae]